MIGIRLWDPLLITYRLRTNAQYTIPGTPEQNGVAERRNRTPMDMVRSMISTCDFPESFWEQC